VPDEVKAFRDTGGAPQELYAQAQVIVRRFHIGGALVGVWMGLAISGKLIAYSIRRRNPDYTADPGTCIACARCFMSCPVELKRRGLISELPVVETAGKS
jgi:NAD-dependent dihydropyrimidine dehydrogenase PreA subunit